jgi:hypothetical protein
MMVFMGREADFWKYVGGMAPGPRPLGRALRGVVWKGRMWDSGELVVGAVLERASTAAAVAALEDAR